jgi:hypothetical protein
MTLFIVINFLVLSIGFVLGYLVRKNNLKLNAKIDGVIDAVKK